MTSQLDSRRCCMEEKKVNFFHKILIVVVMIFAFSKLSKFKFPSFGTLFDQSTKPEPVREVRRSAPPMCQPPQQIIIREYAPPVPVQPTWPTSTYPAPSTRISMPPTTRTSESSGVRFATTPSRVSIDDDTYRRFFG